MAKEKYYPVKHALSKYHCPHCSVYAEQKWSHVSAVSDFYTKLGQYGRPVYQSKIYDLPLTSGNLPEKWSVSICEYCKDIAIWLNQEMIYPKKIMMERPNADLSKDIQKDYLEAANIFNDSPRATAALLRLALQKLCKQLGEKGKNINDDIKNMVSKGLNPLVQKSLDSLRITGNNAVHPGEINLQEESDKVLKLFRILNFIAEKMISEPKELGDFYESLPENAKKAVDKRDEKKKSAH